MQDQRLELIDLKKAALEHLATPSNIGELTLRQGGVVSEYSTKRGVHVVKFVLDPGPDSRLVVLFEQRDETLTGLVHHTTSYRCFQGSGYPHRPSFDKAGQAIFDQHIPPLVEDVIRAGS